MSKPEYKKLIEKPVKNFVQPDVVNEDAKDVTLTYHEINFATLGFESELRVSGCSCLKSWDDGEDFDAGIERINLPSNVVPLFGV